MKIIYLTLLSISALFLTQCEIYREGCMDPNASNYDVAADIDDGCVYDVDLSKIECNSNEAGNLSVTNKTSDVLYLYQNINGVSEYISCIPANSEDFILFVPNENNSIIALQVWKAEVVTNKDTPDISNVYRQWSVALSNTSLEDERASWLITNNNDNISSGTLLLSYPSFDEYNQEVIYQVDIFLNSKTGARLASIKPGTSDKIVSVDYGVHYLYFRYWYSDPNSSSGTIDEIGWMEIKDIVINAEHKSYNIEIPVFKSIVGKYGNLRVLNNTENAISIYANDRLIEKIASVEGSAEGLSIIPANNSTTFLIPEELYTITAKTIDGTTSIITYKEVYNLNSEITELNVGVRHKDISITNNTSERLFLYSEEGYLGKLIEPGASTGSFLVQYAFDSLIVITQDKTKRKKIPATIGVAVNSLEDFITQDLTIVNSWTSVGSAQYKSPDINDNESTIMTANLLNTSTVLLTFEYKVSSEYSYDLFSFSIDGDVLISEVSGDTDWIYYSVNVSSGNHNLKWIYIKDGEFSRGEDNVEIRNISIN